MTQFAINAACSLLVTCVGAGGVDHSALDALLHRHVVDGGVDYAGLKEESAALTGYVASLAHVQVSQMGRNEKLALFLNAYNAATILLIVEHYDANLKSITDIPEAKRWKDRRWDVGGKTYSLDELENEVLRPEFKDPRIHAAINCASVGCPELRAEAYVPDRLDAQLDEQARRFVNNPAQVHVDGSTLRLSAIFDWFNDDFTANGGSVMGFLRRYAAPPLKSKLVALGENPAIEYLPYDWSLNRRAPTGARSSRN